jgi:hypothetical protein
MTINTYRENNIVTSANLTGNPAYEFRHIPTLTFLTCPRPVGRSNICKSRDSILHMPVHRSRDCRNVATRAIRWPDSPGTIPSVHLSNGRYTTEWLTSEVAVEKRTCRE